MIKLGLTGSIATGKSTTAKLFAEEGIPVHDADEAVHLIYQNEGIALVGDLIPSAIQDGIVDRKALKAALASDASLFPRLEAIVHPLVHAREDAAFQKANAAGHAVMVFDIPLLFETGGDARMDKVVVVHCEPETQLTRLLARSDMDEATARMLMDRQMAQEEKKARADFLISTDHGVETARVEIQRILREIRA
ncbi:dephospho-CoA kinase [Ahrensia marina]|uniref:dephospho-CoA kinase n=1 Tax=Ahrensia marina TaxID=1514904 RepID=UPI0035D092A5